MLPPVGGEQAEQHARQGRLAAAGLADDAEDLAAFDGEVDAVDGMQRRRGLEQAAG